MVNNKTNRKSDDAKIFSPFLLSYLINVYFDDDVFRRKKLSHDHDIQMMLVHRTYRRRRIV